MYKVDCYCAALYRHGFVIQTLKSLKNKKEFGTATIVCNNHSDSEWQEMLNAFPDDPRIKFIRDDNRKGSNHKLQYLSNGSNPYIMLFDNDLIYPDDYLEYLTYHCDKFNAMVGLHGVKLFPGLIQSYYRNREVYRGLGEVLEHQEVDLVSNCGSVFKREWFTQEELSEWFDRCGNISMDDIFVGIFMKQKGIKRMVLRHPQGYLKHKEQLPDEYYVFNEYALKPNGDLVQTAIINSVFKTLK